MLILDRVWPQVQLPQYLTDFSVAVFIVYCAERATKAVEGVNLHMKRLLTGHAGASSPRTTRAKSVQLAPQQSGTPPTMRTDKRKYSLQKFMNKERTGSSISVSSGPDTQASIGSSSGDRSNAAEDVSSVEQSNGEVLVVVTSGSTDELKASHEGTKSSMLDEVGYSTFCFYFNI